MQNDYPLPPGWHDPDAAMEATTQRLNRQQVLQYIMDTIPMDQLYHLAQAVACLKQKGFGSARIDVLKGELRFIAIETSEMFGKIE
jgi:hypothetical protein